MMGEDAGYPTKSRLRSTPPPAGRSELGILVPRTGMVATAPGPKPLAGIVYSIPPTEQIQLLSPFDR